jgi:hypothetical protein
VPSGTLTYTFATGLLSGTLSGWTQTVPSGTDPIYVITASALGTGSTDTIATGEWSTPTVIAQNGAQVVSAYRRGIVQPATPTGNSTPTGWSATPVAAVPATSSRSRPRGCPPTPIIRASPRPRIGTNDWATRASARHAAASAWRRLPAARPTRG